MPNVTYNAYNSEVEIPIKSKKARFFKKLFNSSKKERPDYQDLVKHVDHVKYISFKSTFFLNHLLKDHQFIVELPDEDVKVTEADVAFLKSRGQPVFDKINQSLESQEIMDENESIVLLNQTKYELLNYYIKSARTLSKAITRSYKNQYRKIRELEDYSFIELIAVLFEKNVELKHSKKHCVNTLMLRVGDNFGYNLKINIIGSFTDSSKSVNGIQDYSFLYPINYSMILKGEMLPDIQLIKGHLSKTHPMAPEKIDSITILNDPYDELEKILSVTEALKAEIVNSIEFIKEMQHYIEISIDAFVQNENRETRKTQEALKDRMKDINSMIAKVQNERIGLSEESMKDKFPEVSQKDYIILNTFFCRRFFFLKEMLVILNEVYSRNPATIHPFNYDVLKASQKKIKQ